MKIAVAEGYNLDNYIGSDPYEAMKQMMMDANEDFDNLPRYNAMPAVARPAKPQTDDEKKEEPKLKNQRRNQARNDRKALETAAEKAEKDKATAPAERATPKDLKDIVCRQCQGKGHDARDCVKAKAPEKPTSAVVDKYWVNGHNKDGEKRPTLPGMGNEAIHLRWNVRARAK